MLNADIPSTVYSVPTMPAAFSIEAWNALVKGSADGTAAFDLVVLQEHRVTAQDNTLQYVNARVDAIEDKIRGENNFVNNAIRADFQDNMAVQPATAKGHCKEKTTTTTTATTTTTTK